MKTRKKQLPKMGKLHVLQLEYRHRNNFTIVLLEKLAAIELLEFRYTNGELNTRREYRVGWNKIKNLDIDSPHSSTYGSLNKCAQCEI